MPHFGPPTFHSSCPLPLRYVPRLVSVSVENVRASLDSLRHAQQKWQARENELTASLQQCEEDGGYYQAPAAVKEEDAKVVVAPQQLGGVECSEGNGGAGDGGGEAIGITAHQAAALIGVGATLATLMLLLLCCCCWRCCGLREWTARHLAVVGRTPSLSTTHSHLELDERGGGGGGSYPTYEEDDDEARRRSARAAANKKLLSRTSADEDGEVV